MTFFHLKEIYPVLFYLLTLFILASCANNSYEISREFVKNDYNFKEANRGYRNNIVNDKY